MGDPRRFKNKYISPRKLYDKNRIIEETKIKKKYGLRRNKEIWKFRLLLRKLRHEARELIARYDEEKEKRLFNYLRKYGLVGENPTLEDVLNLNIEDLLDRRLQTVVYKKGFARTPLQARQMIVHGHILVNGIKATSPSYLVTVNDEVEIDPESPFAIMEKEKQKRVSE